MVNKKKARGVIKKGDLKGLVIKCNNIYSDEGAIIVATLQKKIERCAIYRVR